HTAQSAVVSTPTMEYWITGLTMGTWYYIRVTAHHTLGYGTPSNVYPFKPHQQPDGPQTPELHTSDDAADLSTYARSLTVDWSYPKISGPDLVGDGGDSVTSYMVEWCNTNFSAATLQVQTITLTMNPASANSNMKFQLSMTTSNLHNMA